MANQLVSSMYDPSRGLLGAVLIRTPDQEPLPTQIFEPATASATQVRPLVSADLRQLVTEGGQIGWQSVNLQSDGETIPGIVVGTTLDIRGSGSYELYAAYSLGNQQSLISTTIRVMWLSTAILLAILGVVSWAVTRWVLTPVRAASRGAQLLADGEFDTRREVRGSD
ncbi:UNVERIFIED_CONTAM: HAMP domain-containing protein, partial [Bacillus subtilis]